MREIDSNREAWGKLAREHYRVFSKQLKDGTKSLNHYIQRELGNIAGKDVIHLQCNTGADTILLARLGAKSVTGVDLSPENIFYAKKLAADLGVPNVTFVESDIMTLAQAYAGKHDLVFTSEGVLGWLPDLEVWAKTVRALLRESGSLYVFDSHPFFLSLDEQKLGEGKTEIKYPYFGKEPDVDDTIGGYACEAKDGVKAYFWMHTMSDLITSLSLAGMHVEYLHEFPENFFDSGNMTPSRKEGLWEYGDNRGKYPMSFSLRASVYPGR